MIKKEFSDSKDRRIQIRAVSRRTSFLTVELKFNRFKLRSFIASISNLTIKEFARIQRNKDREKLKWKRAQIFVQRVEKRNWQTFHRFFKDFSQIAAVFTKHLLQKSMNNEFEWISFISSAFSKASLNLAIFKSSFESSSDIENLSLFNYKARD